MSFRFPLQTVLRSRQIVEEREERLLQQILSQIAQSRQTLRDLDAQRRNLFIQRESALQKSITRCELTHFYERIRQIDDLELAGKDHLAKLIKLREQQMAIYEAAHRDKELVTTMKSKQCQNFQREQTRREQGEQDDLFSSRRSLR